MTTAKRQRKIKTFVLSGQMLDDSHAYITKVNADHTISYMMRDSGYLRVLDLDPSWSVYYNHDEDIWSFEMIMYGVYAGKRKAKQFAGISQGKLIPRLMYQDKSKKSLNQ
jgi:hypothetical protein